MKEEKLKIYKKWFGEYHIILPKTKESLYTLKANHPYLAEPEIISELTGGILMSPAAYYSMDLDLLYKIGIIRKGYKFEKKEQKWKQKNMPKFTMNY